MVEVALAGGTGSEILVVASLKEFQRVQSRPEGNFYPEWDDKREGEERGAAERGHEQAKYTEKLMNDKELTSFRKLTNWSTVK